MFRVIYLILITLGLSIGCSGENQGMKEANSGKPSNVHWGYSGQIGPTFWGSLADEFVTCDVGREQSPINIKTERVMNLSPLEFSYKPSRDSVIVNNTHTLQITYENGSFMEIAGKQYELLQFHFHSPSEHKIHGKRADLVAHLVHKSQKGEIAVLAILFDEGMADELVSTVWANAPRKKGNSMISGEINVKDWLPSDKTYYNYSGSLTTPPCTEKVNWNILQSKLSVSKKQVADFKKIFKKSTRPIQALNDRVVGVK